MTLDMRTRLLRATSGVLAAAALAGCTGEAPSVEPGEFPEAPLATLTTEGGKFSMEVRTAPMQPPSRGSIDIELAIFGPDGEPRDDLDLRVVPWMPDMAHGASDEPAIVPMGGGRYELGPVDMFMSGRWELRTTIAGPSEDRAKILFEIP